MSATAVGHPPRTEIDGRARLVLLVLLLGQAMAALDTSIVNVAAPAIQRGLGASGAALQLAVAAYLLTYAVLLMTGARLGTVHGYTRVFVFGAALFTVTSGLCGLAPNAEVLVAARAAQGVGAAAMVPQVLSLIQVLFRGAARSRAVGLHSLMLGAGVAVGQVLGGVLVDVDLAGLHWRPIFLVNVPVGLVLLVGARRWLPQVAPADGQQLDLRGVGLLSGGLLLILIPLILGRERGWPPWTAPSLVAGVAGLLVFYRHEGSLVSRGGQPLVAPALLRRFEIGASLLIVAVQYVGYGGLLFTSALFLQTDLNFNPLRSGLTFAAYAVAFGSANLLWTRLPTTWQRWVPLGGMLVLVGANSVLAVLLETQHTWSAGATAALALAGLGHGAAFGSLVGQLMSRVAAREAPSISGAVPTVIQIAIAVGVAGLGSLFLAGARPGGRVGALALGRVALVLAVADALAAGLALCLATVGERKSRAGSCGSGLVRGGVSSGRLDG